MGLRKRGYVFALMLMLLMVLGSNSAFAADWDYRLMHNDHDALVIGEITEIVDNKMLVQVEKQIINPEGWDKKQTSLSGIIAVDSIEYYRFFVEGDEEGKPKVGDYILASLDKSQQGFKEAYGIHKVDSKDYKTLRLIIPSNKTASAYLNVTIAAINHFINSDGKDSEFSYDGNRLYLGEKLIYEYIGPEATNQTSADEVDQVILAKETEDKESFLSKTGVLIATSAVLLIILVALIYRLLSPKRNKQ